MNTLSQMLLASSFLLPTALVANTIQHSAPFTAENTKALHKTLDKQSIEQKLKLEKSYVQGASSQNTNQHTAWLYSADITLVNDNDSDGYFQQLNAVVDFDTQYSSHAVDAEFYLLGTNGVRINLHHSTTFTLYGDSHSDTQVFQFKFESDIPTDLYQLVIELHDAASGSVLYDSYYNFHSSLHQIPLESDEYDSYYPTELKIFDVDTSLTQDLNSNGYYERFSLSLDADTNEQSTRVFAEIYIGNRLIYQSSPFWLHGDSSSDRQYFDVKLNSGFNAGYYNLEVVLRSDNDHFEPYKLNSSVCVNLGNIPLESEYNSSTTEITVTQSSGSISGLLLLLAVAVGLKRLSVKKHFN
jgi:hypothetical protein